MKLEQTLIELDSWPRKVERTLMLKLEPMLEINKVELTQMELDSWRMKVELTRMLKLELMLEADEVGADTDDSWL